jgi:hypothetical protein
MKNLLLLTIVVYGVNLTAQPTLGFRSGASTFYYDLGGEDHSPPRFFISVPVEWPVKKWFSVQPEQCIGQRSLKAHLAPDTLNLPVDGGKFDNKVQNFTLKYVQHEKSKIFQHNNHAVPVHPILQCPG